MNRNPMHLAYGYTPNGRNFVIISRSYDPSKLEERQINKIIKNEYEQFVGRLYDIYDLVITTYRKSTPKHRRWGIHRKSTPKHVIDVRASVPDAISGDQLSKRIEEALAVYGV